MAFFNRTSVPTARRQSTLSRCGECGRCRKCETPKMEPIGKGRQGILIVAEAPGQADDEAGHWLAGSNMKPLLESSLQRHGLSLRKDCWLTGAVLCHGQSDTGKAVDCCRPNLLKTIKELDPVCIIPIGSFSTSSIISYLWKKDSGEFNRWVGWQIPSQEWNCWICPNYHPAFVSKAKDPVSRVWFDRYIDAAIETIENGRPWNELPKWKKQVWQVYDTEDITAFLDSVGNAKKGWAAFDYECNCLKPEREGAKVLSASVCIGGWDKGWRTAAFPMTRQIHDVWIEFLQSPVPKIAANIKFEDRWSNVYFGSSVNNWAWDTMLASHVLDNRPSITGLKFQAFARLGFGVYDHAVAPFIESREDGLNRLRELDIETLLLYNGLDSLLEHRLAVTQMRDFGHKPYWRI